MQLELEQLRTLRAVVEHGTLDAAAATLHVTPSAVSQRLKALETVAGQVLLIRSKPARPTQAGETVLRLARQVELLEADTAAELAGEDAGPAALGVAVNADSLATWFLPALARVAERYPVTFDLHRDDQEFTAGLLESGTVMGAVTSQATPVAGCLVRPLGVMRYEAVATPAFAARWGVEVAAGGRADAAALASAPLVDFDRRDDLQREFLAASGIDPEVPPRHYVPASHDFATAIKLGLGWGMLPGFQSHDELVTGDLVRLGGAPIDVPLHWQQWNLRSPLLDAIAEELHTEGRTALET
jgi:LysR family transcriptional regulator (chromosome initiation inhibitor)